MGGSCDQLHTAPIDLNRLTKRLYWYGTAHGVSSKALGDMEGILRSPTVAELLKLPPEDWDDVLVNDIYKATMHRMYAAFLGDVTAEFALHVRRSPMTLHALAQTHPHVFQALHARVARLRDVQPYGPAVQQALRVHGAGFELTQEMVCRAEAYGVAPVSWSAECCDGIPRTALAPQTLGTPAAGQQGDARGGQEGLGDLSPAGSTWVTPELRSQECDVSLVGEGWVNLQNKDCSCIAAGPIESASHCETTVMQLVQEAFIAAQVEDIRAQYQQTIHPGSDRLASPADLDCSWPDRTELLASSLAHLCHVIDALNSRPHGMHISLFAGRRSSNRLFLVLQNLAFAKMVKGYGGTSSIYVAAMLGKVWDILGWSPSERVACLGPLVGTHAHEQSSILQQLLADLDWRAGQEAALPPAQGATTAAPAPPLPLTSLLAHLLFLTASGDLRLATALPDTFGTPGFLRAALAADVPEAFVERLMSVSGQTVHTGAKCFDLFRVWRVDSGSYEEIAELIISAWENRCRALALQPPHAQDGAQAPYPAASVVEATAAADPAAAAEPAAGAAAGAVIGEAALVEGLEKSSSNSNSRVATSSGDSGGAGGARGGGGVVAGPPSLPPLPRPVLMHSNLSSVQEVLQVADLPERIRPQIVAFGTLADGFFPLVPPMGPSQQASSPAGPGAGPARTAVPYPLQMASLVMKAVQARAPKVTVTQPSALKIGDLAARASEGKVERDPRLGPEAQEEMQRLVEVMRRAQGPWDEGVVSRALADAYRQVVEEHLLQP